MSRLMTVLGIVFLAIGAAIAVVGLARPGQMQVSGLTMDSAALLLMTGIIALGFGGLIEAMQSRAGASATVAETPAEADEQSPAAIAEAPAPAPVEAPVIAATAPAAEEAPSRIRFPGFGRKQTAEVATAATATAAAVTVAAAETSKSAVDDTINALEKAKQDIASALGGVERISTSPPPAAAMPEPEVEDVAEDESVDDDELYVVEEKIIRGRPARILSDDTVEAETDEGWMRFENLEHLNEYLDAAEA